MDLFAIRRMAINSDITKDIINIAIESNQLQVILELCTTQEDNFLKYWLANSKEG